MPAPPPSSSAPRSSTTNPPAPRPSPDSLSSALSTGRSLIALQLLTRLLTFGLNQSLVRLAPPEALGTASIQFDLLCDTIRFLSREGIRNALLRSSGAELGPSEGDGSEGIGEKQSTGKGKGKASRAPTQGDEQERLADNLARVPLYLSIGVTIGAASLYLYTASLNTTRQPDFFFSLSLYVLAAVLEIGIEPLYIRTLRSGKLQIRVRAEGGMATARAVLTVLMIIAVPRRPLLAFALGQLGGALWLVRTYVADYGLGSLSLSPRASPGQQRFDTETVKLAIANTRQSVIKHLLTEADRIAVGRISPLQDQGGYAVAMNYGSLIARIVFQPLEETLFLHFSTHGSDATSPVLLRFVTHLSSYLLVLLPNFLPPLLPAVLPFLLPRRYLRTTAPSTLEAYLSFYVPLLSLNGILEAYHSSSASPAQIARQARWMVFSSLIFIGSLYGLTHLPFNILPAIGLLAPSKEQALIYSSCFSMIIRIIYAFQHARRSFASRPPDQQFTLRSVAPPGHIVALCVGQGQLLRKLARDGDWARSTRGWMQLLGIGAGMGFIQLALIMNWTTSSALKVRDMMRAKQE